MKEEMKQLSLFSEEETRPEVRRPKRNGGSQNSIVFNDYDSFIAKFSDNPKTTDDCYTPKDVYEAVVKWVGENYDLSEKKKSCVRFSPVATMLWLNIPKMAS